MRVGLLCWPGAGGSGVLASELGRALARLGHDVHLFSYRRPFRLRGRVAWHQITLPEYPLFEYPSYGMAAAARIAGVRLDVLHAHYAYPHALSAHLAREMSPRPFRTVTTLHGTDLHLLGTDDSFSRVVRFGLERSDAVSTVSAFLARGVRAALGWSRPVRVVPNFVDLRRFRPSARAHSGPPTIVHVTNFRPVKRSLDAVRVLARLRTPARLHFVGSGPEEAAARRLAERLGVSRRVRFAGEVADVAGVLRSATLLLSTSAFEGFGLAVLEAMASGVPVVSTASGGVQEAAGRSALVAPVGDAAALARRTEEVLRDRDLARHLGREGRRRAEELFDLDRVVPQYESLYTGD
jgi:N-acetyl-alpha-D-glucosaminyl L-malate synthase BshA